MRASQKTANNTFYLILWISKCFLIPNNIQFLILWKSSLSVFGIIFASQIILSIWSCRFRKRYYFLFENNLPAGKEVIILKSLHMEICLCCLVIYLSSEQIILSSTGTKEAIEEKHWPECYWEYEEVDILDCKCLSDFCCGSLVHYICYVFTPLIYFHLSYWKKVIILLERNC